MFPESFRELKIYSRRESQQKSDEGRDDLPSRQVLKKIAMGWFQPNPSPCRFCYYIIMYQSTLLNVVAISR